MKFICVECGHVFEEPTRWEESRGEFWGVPCSEPMCGCPECYGAFEEISDRDMTEDEAKDIIEDAINRGFIDVADRCDCVDKAKIYLAFNYLLDAEVFDI